MFPSHMPTCLVLPVEELQQQIPSYNTLQASGAKPPEHLPISSHIHWSSEPQLVAASCHLAERPASVVSVRKHFMVEVARCKWWDAAITCRSPIFIILNHALEHPRTMCRESMTFQIWTDVQSAIDDDKYIWSSIIIYQISFVKSGSSLDILGSV